MPKSLEKAAAPLWRSKRGRPEGRDEKSEVVLRAASQHFNEKGYSSTSLSEIAETLGITKPVIYYYFKSKDEILFTCCRVGLRQLREAASHAKQIEGSGLDRLSVVMKEYARIITVGYGGCVARTNDQELTEESRKIFRRLKRDYDDIIKEFIAEAIEDGSIAHSDVKLVSFVLAGAINWMTRWYSPSGRLSAEQIAENIVHIISGSPASR